MRITKIANKKLNLERLMDELRPLGISGISFVGFKGADENFIYIETPFLVRTEIGHTTRDGVRTAKFADPGELHLEAPSDPGVALDTALANHDFGVKSVGQAERDDREVDKVLVQADIDSGNPISNDGVKALARLVLFKNPIR